VLAVPDSCQLTLTGAGISCNVIAGLAHDHLFVEWAHRARALALLREL
jgi:uncharacterized protein